MIQQGKDLNSQPLHTTCLVTPQMNYTRNKSIGNKLLAEKQLQLFASMFTDPLFSLQSPPSARDKKLKKPGGFIDRRNVFGFSKGTKNEKKNITTSVYRLTVCIHLDAPKISIKMNIETKRRQRVKLDLSNVKLP